MSIGIAADHGGFELKMQLTASLKAAGYEVVDFGAHELITGDDYPDFVVPLARAVASGEVTRGVAICGSGVGACVAANKVAGVRAALITDSFSAHQGVEDDDMNVICLGGRVTGHALPWDLVQTFLSAHFKGDERFRRRLAKVAALERKKTAQSPKDPDVSSPPGTHRQLLHTSIVSTETIMDKTLQGELKGPEIQAVKSPQLTDDTHQVVAELAFLDILPGKLERPMLLLSFIWFLVIIAELVNGMNPLLQTLGTVLWALFVFYFCLRLAIVPNRVTFLKRNWFFILAILVPVLRLVPFLQTLPLARALTATFGMQVIWMFASADQGLRSLRRTVGHRGAGYALTFTVVVILAGAAGMLHFENDSPGPQGIHSYPKALWWVAMQITNIGSGYQPVTPGGQALCLGISIFAVAVFGYLTAVFAAFFIGRDAEDPKSQIPNQGSIHQLSGEVALLRKSIEDVLRQIPDVTPRLDETPQLSKETGPIRQENVSGAAGLP